MCISSLSQFNPKLPIATFACFEMFRDTLIKTRAVAALAVAVLLYPLALLLAVLSKVFDLCCCFKVKNDIGGEVAVVTGAGHGLGKAIAIELAKKGCQVAAVDINIEGAEATAKLITDTYNLKAKAYKVNVVNYNEIVALKEAVNRDLGAVTVLINNAGVLLIPNCLSPDWQDVQRMINVNMTAHFWTNSVFLPEMKQRRKGYIVAISSLAGLFPLAYNTPYTATKFGVRGFMQALRQELAIERQRSIHASTVMPGFLATNLDVVDIVNKTGINNFYPTLSGADTAKRIVLGMLRHEHEIIIPGFVALAYRLLNNLPARWQTNITLPFVEKTMKRFLEMCQ